LVYDRGSQREDILSDAEAKRPEPWFMIFLCKFIKENKLLLLMPKEKRSIFKKYIERKF